MKELRVYNRFEIIREMALIHDKIIDIGCNIGETFGARATNVDIHSLEDKRKESGDPNLIIPNFIHASGESLPMIKDLEYDCAVCSEVLEHTEDPLKLLNEAQRIARILVICVPLEFEWAKERRPFQNSDHKRSYTEQDFFKLIYESGLKIVEAITLRYDGWSYVLVEGISKNIH
jgi:ubiquinone/menaquinone biosynthesis C-methylase UbiE